MLDLDDATARAAIDRLHCAAGVHVSARLSWAQAWRDADPRARPWVLGLRGPGGDLRALAMLSMSRRAGVAQIRCLGHAVLDRAPIVSRGAADAHDLAEALAAELRALRRPWTLHLRQLPVGDAFAGALARRLVAVDSLPDGQRPLTLVTGDAARTPIVSRNLRKTEARARNRIARAGLACDIGWVCDGRQIALRMPEIRSVHRARDVQLRGYSTLDDPVEGAFYDALFGRHLDALELLEVRLDGQLAAYLVCDPQPGGAARTRQPRRAALDRLQRGDHRDQHRAARGGGGPRHRGAGLGIGRAALQAAGGHRRDRAASAPRLVVAAPSARPPRAPAVQPPMSTGKTFVGSIVTITRVSPGASWSRTSPPYLAPTRSANA